MRILLLVCVLTLPVFTASYSTKIKQWVFPQKAVSKDINLTIGAINNYKSKAYAHSSMQLDIVLIKLSGNKVDTLLAQNYADVKLNRLPSFAKNFDKNIHIDNIADKSEQVVLLYNIIYKSKGSVLEVPNAKWLAKGQSKNDVLIDL